MTQGGGEPGPRPIRSGRLAVLAIIIFALAFAIGGFFAVKAITSGRRARDAGRPDTEAPREDGSAKDAPGKD